MSTFRWTEGEVVVGRDAAFLVEAKVRDEVTELWLDLNHFDHLSH